MLNKGDVSDCGKVGETGENVSVLQRETNILGRRGETLVLAKTFRRWS